MRKPLCTLLNSNKTTKLFLDLVLVSIFFCARVNFLLCTCQCSPVRVAIIAFCARVNPAFLRRRNTRRIWRPVAGPVFLRQGTHALSIVSKFSVHEKEILVNLQMCLTNG